MNEARLPDHAASHGGLGLVAERVVAEVVGHASGAPAFSHEFYQHFRFARIHRQGFFAEHVLSRAEHAAGLLEVQMIGRADVRHADSGVRGQIVERGGGALEAQRLANFFAAVAETAEHAAHWNAYSWQRV